MNTTRKEEKKKQQKKKKTAVRSRPARGGWLLDKIKRRAVSALSQQSFYEEERYHREAPPLPWQEEWGGVAGYTPYPNLSRSRRIVLCNKGGRKKKTSVEFAVCEGRLPAVAWNARPHDISAFHFSQFNDLFQGP